MPNFEFNNLEIKVSEEILNQPSFASIKKILEYLDEAVINKDIVVYAADFSKNNLDDTIGIVIKKEDKLYYARPGDLWWIPEYTLERKLKLNFISQDDYNDMCLDSDNSNVIFLLEEDWKNRLLGKIDKCIKDDLSKNDKGEIWNHIMEWIDYEDAQYPIFINMATVTNFENTISKVCENPLGYYDLKFVLEENSNMLQIKEIDYDTELDSNKKYVIFYADRRQYVVNVLHYQLEIYLPKYCEKENIIEESQMDIILRKILDNYKTEK